MKTQTYILIVFCTVLVASFSCHKPLITTCKICGKVTEQNNIPVGGAKVEVSESILTYTQSNGEYCIDNLDPGKYNFTISKNGYCALQKNVDVNLEQQSQDFNINKMVALFGKDTIVNITGSSATAIGTITDLGYLGYITQHGHCWSSTNNNPTIYDSKTTLDSLKHPAQFTSTLTGLSPNTTYYVRAYASNSIGIAYGNMLSFTNGTNLPTVSTNTVTNITGTTAISGGNVTNDGNITVTSRGVCWGTNQNPNTSGSHTTDSSGIGSFISSLTGLSGTTTYYVRAYATNSVGTAYGNQVKFTIYFNCGVQTLTDIDGNSYNTVQIGTQCWLKENIKVTKYRNGDQISNITDATEWSNLITGAYCDYNNSVSNSTIYGKLYNYYTVADSRNLCPTGCHVPTDAEWTTLTTYLEPNAGDKLKEAGSTHWQSLNSGATNESGFTALPGGWRSGGNGMFINLGSEGCWWSSTEYDIGKALFFSLYYNSTSPYISINLKHEGYSVRCVKD